MNNTNCCVYGCHSRKSKDRSLSFHLFPKTGMVLIINAGGVIEQVDRRKAWENALHMGKKSTIHMKVCSKHFRKEDYIISGRTRKVSLKKSAVPSQNLPSKSVMKQVNLRAQRTRYNRLQRRADMNSSLVLSKTAFISCGLSVTELVYKHRATTITDVSLFS